MTGRNLIYLKSGIIHDKKSLDITVQGKVPEMTSHSRVKVLQAVGTDIILFINYVIQRLDIIQPQHIAATFDANDRFLG